MKFNILFFSISFQIILIRSETIQIESFFPVPEKNNQLSHMSVGIINCCFNKKHFIFLTVPNSPEENILNPLSSFSTVSLLFDIHHESTFEKNGRFQKVYILNETHVDRPNFPVTGVAMIITSNGNFSSILLKIKNSIWWNHEAQFLLINTAADGCQRAHSFLQTLRKYNVLSAIYLCTKPNSVVSIYTYNPYSRIAPTSWKQVQETPSPNGLAMLEFAEKQLIKTLLDNQTSAFPLCSLLFYDKIRNLENYNLKMVIFKDPKIFHYRENRSGYERCDSSALNRICIILEHIRATVTVKMSNKPNLIDIRGEPQGPIRDVLNNIVDIVTIPLFLRDFWKNQLYPIDSAELRIVTLKSTHNSMDKFLAILKFKFWIYFIVSCFMCVIAMKYILEVSLLDALFEFLRMFSCTSGTKQPRKLISRIFFIIISMFIFVIGSSFQSHLNAVSIIPNSVAMIDSVEDLMKSNLSVYGYPSYKGMIPDDVLRERFHGLDTLDGCAIRLFNGDPIACIMSSTVYSYYLSENKSIHISEESVVKKYFSYVFVDDSPILYKFNLISARLSEGGFFKLFMDREKFYYVKDLDDADLPKPINFDELKLIFSLLLGGWILAIFAFSSEICVY